MATVLAFMNLKGGVGKTVLAANLAREIATKDRRDPKDVLLIDLDPQCSLSYLFSNNDEVARLERHQTALEAMWPENGGPVELLKHRKNLFSPTGMFRRSSKGKVDLIRGSMDIYKIIANGGANIKGHCLQNFKAFVEAVSSNYDFIIIDTNPSTNIASLCGLAAANFVVAPMKLDMFSVLGILMLQEIFASEYPHLNAESKRLIGVWNVVDRKLRHSPGTSPLERSLHQVSPEIFATAVGSRIYETSYLHYRERSGFIHNFTGVRVDFLRQAVRDLSNVCNELLQRVSDVQGTAARA